MARRTVTTEAQAQAQSRAHAPPGSVDEAHGRVPVAEAQLVSRLLARDEAAFTNLVERYQGALVRLARVYVGTHSIAEEVAQETWVAVLNGLPNFEGRSSLKTWIFRILTNRAKSRGAREGRSVPFSTFTSDDAEPAVDPARFQSSGMWAEPPPRWNSDTPDRLLLRKESRQSLDEAIDALPPAQRAVLTLRDLEGVGADEVCNILGLSETNQRVLLHRARAKLRRALEGYLGGV